MNNIFSLFCNNKLVKTFNQLSLVIDYITKLSCSINYEIYVEEYNADMETHAIKTLLYKNNIFQIENIFEYY
jgi:hypothetical protein